MEMHSSTASAVASGRQAGCQHLGRQQLAVDAEADEVLLRMAGHGTMIPCAHVLRHRPPVSVHEQPLGKTDTPPNNQTAAFRMQESRPPISVSAQQLRSVLPGCLPMRPSEGLALLHASHDRWLPARQAAAIPAVQIQALQILLLLVLRPGFSFLFDCACTCTRLCHMHDTL